MKKYDPGAVNERLFYLGVPFGLEPICYLSGPMTGLPEFNKSSFVKGAAMLREAGWFVYNPVENDAEAGIDLTGKTGHEEFSYKNAMKRDLAQVCDSDAVFVLPGWELSKGAQLEVHVANEVKVPVYSLLSGRPIDPPAVSPYAHEFSSQRDPEQQFISNREGYEQSVNEHLAPGITGHEAVRRFESGATRNVETNKPDYEGFLSPLVIAEFGRYMHEHRHQADGSTRDSDNWQKGIPLAVYMKSLLRHVFDVWVTHRGHETFDHDSGNPVHIEDSLDGVIFNAMGMLHEILKKRATKKGVEQMVGSGVRLRFPKEAV